MASITIDERGILETLDGSGTTIAGNVLIEGNINISGEIAGQKKNIITSSKVLTLADSGAVIIASGSTAQTFTLPSISGSNGFSVTFHAASQHAHVITGSNMQGALYHNSNTINNLSRNLLTNAERIVLNSTNPRIGDYITIVSDGSQYYIFGWLNAGATITQPR